MFTILSTTIVYVMTRYKLYIVA